MTEVSNLLVPDFQKKIDDVRKTCGFRKDCLMRMDEIESSDTLTIAFNEHQPSQKGEIRDKGEKIGLAIMTAKDADNAIINSIQLLNQDGESMLLDGFTSGIPISIHPRNSGDVWNYRGEDNLQFEEIHIAAPQNGIAIASIEHELSHAYSKVRVEMNKLTLKEDVMRDILNGNTPLSFSREELQEWISQDGPTIHIDDVLTEEDAKVYYEDEREASIYALDKYARVLRFLKTKNFNEHMNHAAEFFALALRDHELGLKPLINNSTWSIYQSL